MVFCNVNTFSRTNKALGVTILILVDGFLQFETIDYIDGRGFGHNPYFSRWFSAIEFGEYKKKMYGESQSLF